MSRHAWVSWVRFRNPRNVKSCSGCAPEDFVGLEGSVALHGECRSLFCRARSATPETHEACGLTALSPLLRRSQAGGQDV